MYWMTCTSWVDHRGQYLDVGYVSGRCFGSLKGLMVVNQYEVYPRDTCICCLLDNLICSEGQTFLEMTAGVLLWFLRHSGYSA